jgi:membrane associated rhomboid family serine protease
MNRSEIRQMLRAMVVPLIFVAICWAVWLVDTTYHLKLFYYGLHPQDLIGLRGIILSPFLHDPWDISHILNNTTPILFLGWALFFFYRETAWKVILGIWLLSGIWVWLIPDPNYHIGASGILYGLASFLFYSGVIRRQTNLMGLTLLVTFLYGSMIWGIFPYDIRISWQSHLCGGIAGLIFAIYYRKEGLQREKYEWENEDSNESFSEISQRHEDALLGKTEEPEEKKEENTEIRNESDKPELRINYEYKPKDN